MAFRLSGVILMLGLVWLPTPVPASVMPPQWVDFPAASTPPSTLRIRLARAKGLEAKPRVGTAIRGLLFKPVGDGPFAAVVMLHDCRGIRSYQKDWASKLAAWGYVALLVDSFDTRGVSDVCADLLKLEAREEVGGRVFDAYGALDHLTRLPYVDPARIAVMGWGVHTTLDAVNEVGAQSLYESKFRAAVAFYPECRYTTSSRFMAPTLILTGIKDDWARALPCARMGAAGLRGSAPVEVSVHPSAAHGFDDPEVGDYTYLADALNLNKQPARGATLRYNRAAHMNAISIARRFLDSQLQSDDHSWNSLYTDAFHSFRSGRHPGTWVVDPKRPGPNLPPTGRSVFDYLFTTDVGGGPRYDIPFPFSALLRKIRHHLGTEQASPRPLIKTTLFPLGRSLQRNAANPEFFKYPRVVVAVDSEPAAPVNNSTIYLKDRLFLGYVEKTKVLEIISYNEGAGRFEFQVVRNYGPGLVPQVHYANRALCMSCHQNGAPLFPEAGWDETTDNPAITKRLRQERNDFYGIVPSNAIPAATLDNSTDRANLFSALQLLWRQGCGGNRDDIDALRCRAAMFTAMLQYRLTNAADFDTRSQRYQRPERYIDQELEAAMAARAQGTERQYPESKTGDHRHPYPRSP